MKPLEFHLSWGRIILLLVLLSYPANWYMMRQGWGSYNNNPEAVSTPLMYDHSADTRPELKGPDYDARAVCLAFSPIIAPVQGIYQLAKMTGTTHEHDR
jgi:hypothetical protein